MDYGRVGLLGLMTLAGAAFAAACATSVTPASTGSGLGGDDTSTTDASSSSSTTGDGGGTASATSSTGPGPCTTAADCAAFTDACNDGACINGTCDQLPKNELGACDDGLECTQNDACQAGACLGGTQKFCPSSSSCMIGTCDAATDACIEVPGNDGASCVDNDPCTLTGVCGNGACQPGTPTDCSFLDGVCSVGKCDPQLGCVASPVNNGTPCNDNLYCTVNDTCNAGMCTGVPNTCAAPGDVCMIGSCNEAMDTCVAVPGNNGGACNDNNLCTTGETCSNGVCGGGLPGNNGMACDDGNGCTGGTTCTNGNCGNPTSQILACVDNDMCCPAGCVVDNDCAVCHPIGFDMCPTGETEWCSPDPVDPTSAVQAKLACDTCYGISCFLETADCAGQGYGPQPPGAYVCNDAYFGFESGCSGDAGRVWAICSSFTTDGYWSN
jgi:hypothetical protein